MALLVDDIRHYERVKLPWKDWCHLMSDRVGEEGIAELHAFAKRLGLRREYVQTLGSVPHYDLVPSKRALAIQYGAHAVTVAEMLPVDQQWRAWNLAQRGMGFGTNS